MHAAPIGPRLEGRAAGQRLVGAYDQRPMHGAVCRELLRYAALHVLVEVGEGQVSAQDEIEPAIGGVRAHVLKQERHAIGDARREHVVVAGSREVSLERVFVELAKVARRITRACASNNAQN